MGTRKTHSTTKLLLIFFFTIFTFSLHNSHANENPIKTIVILVMENRSFDHMLGWMKKLNPNINGVTGLESAQLSVTDPNSKRIFFKNEAKYVDPDPGHSFQAIREQIFGSEDTSLDPAPMNGFAQQAYSMDNTTKMSQEVMNGFEPDHVAVYKTLVSEFAVFDRLLKMSSSRGGNSNSRGSHSFSISRNGGSSRNVARVAAARNPELTQSMLPACGCYLPMKMYISTTLENYGRRFWKCRNWNRRSVHTCELFIWDDDIIPGVTPMIDVEPVVDVSVEQERSGRSGVEAVNSQQACSKCSNIEEVMKTFESIEVDKWKTKYRAERNKVMWIALALMISWFFLCVYAKN